jgi:hypothetical protein
VRVEVNGFSVLAAGKLTSTFCRGLRNLSERGFCDPGCTVVKTAPGGLSGITHWGGRYVHPNNPCAQEVMELMQTQGIEPPAPPFVVAPGEATLYHEWGHHVDRCWSDPRQQVQLSFFFLSPFYDLEALAPDESLLRAHLPPGNERLEAAPDHQRAATDWYRLSSELFADLFEDWMRGDNKIDLDCCDPALLNSETALPVRYSRLAFAPGVCSDDIRTATYALFAAGLQRPPPIPELREGFFGPDTGAIVDRLQRAVRQVTEQMSH